MEQKSIINQKYLLNIIHSLAKGPKRLAEALQISVFSAIVENLMKKRETFECKTRILYVTLIVYNGGLCTNCTDLQITENKASARFYFLEIDIVVERCFQSISQRNDTHVFQKRGTSKEYTCVS